MLTRRALLNRRAWKIGLREGGECDWCDDELETMEHFLLECKHYEVERREMMNEVGGDLKLETLFITDKGAKAVAEYVRRTEGWAGILGWTFMGGVRREL